MDTSMFHWGITILKFVWGKILYPPLMFTGLIFPLALSFAGFVIGWEPGIVWWIVAWALVPYTFIQNIVRKIKHDPKYNLLLNIIGVTASRSEKKLTDPPAPKEMQFDEPQGFIFGKKRHKWICLNGQDGHILVLGGPGSGKSKACAIPSLMSWNRNEAVFAIDIKGELSQFTARKRKEYKIFSLQPEDYGYNPFYCINKNQNLIQQMREIAISLCPVPPGTKDPFWLQSAQSFICGALIWGFRSNINFAEVMRIIKRTPPAELAEQICNSDIEEAILFMNQFRAMPDETLGGVYSEVSNTVLVFATNEALINTLNKPKEKCIMPSDLDNNISLYIQLEEYQLEQMKNFLTLLVNQFLKHFERRSEKSTNRILFLLDEFARLGKIESILNGLATLRSKQITIALLFQSLSQMDAIYGHDQRKVICDSCGYWAVLRVNDSDTQKYISSAIGQFDKVKKSSSTNRGDFKTIGSSGITVSEELRQIVPPEELGRLKDELILLSPYGFARIDKTYCFNTPEFQI